MQRGIRERGRPKGTTQGRSEASQPARRGGGELALQPDRSGGPNQPDESRAGLGGGPPAV